jgi:hypothetical protein
VVVAGGAAAAVAVAAVAAAAAADAAVAAAAAEEEEEEEEEAEEQAEAARERTRIRNAKKKPANPHGVKHILPCAVIGNSKRGRNLRLPKKFNTGINEPDEEHAKEEGEDDEGGGGEEEEEEAYQGSKRMKRSPRQHTKHHPVLCIDEVVRSMGADRETEKLLRMHCQSVLQTCTTLDAYSRAQVLNSLAEVRRISYPVSARCSPLILDTITPPASHRRRI